MKHDITPKELFEEAQFFSAKALEQKVIGNTESFKTYMTISNTFLEQAAALEAQEKAA